MKAAAAIAAVIPSLPALAYACPGAACGCAASSWSQYVSAVGIGVLVGIGSVSLEQLWRSRRSR